MKSRQRGYTAVELVMALAILGVGVSGVIAMQKITIVSNQHAKNMAIAQRVAEGWAEALALDASSWNWTDEQPADLMNDTFWLNRVGNAVWFRPAYVAAFERGAGFDALGAPLADATGAVFCTDLRLMYLDDGLPGNGTPHNEAAIRAEIRVFWRRETVGPGAPAGFCGAGGEAPANISVPAIADNYHFVNVATAIIQQSGKEP